MDLLKIINFSLGGMAIVTDLYCSLERVGGGRELVRERDL